MQLKSCGTLDIWTTLQVQGDKLGQVLCDALKEVVVDDGQQVAGSHDDVGADAVPGGQPVLG